MNWISKKVLLRQLKPFIKRLDEEKVNLGILNGEL